MINVKIRRDEEGYIYGYSVEGHTENGNEVDEAVACNSVSVVTQFPLIGAQRQLKLNAEIAVDKTNDAVQHPSHYTQGKVECIEALESATAGLTGIEAVCTANAIKYLWRYKHKNGVQDVKKAQWYINHLIKHLEGEEK